tara:strand:+ start:1592 stop:1900 length:309 start_codon:yes stop_codon:yes gene_type:complete
MFGDHSTNDKPPIVLDDGKNPIVEVFSTNDCPWCDKAIQLITASGLRSKKMVVGEDLTLSEFTIVTNGAQTVPQIFINGNHIGGYEALVKHFEAVASGEIDL